MKKVAISLKIICATLFFALGVVIMMFGLFRVFHYSSYNGDIYNFNEITITEEILNRISRNIYELDNNFSNAISLSYILIGILLMIIGIYVLACAFSLIGNTRNTSSSEDNTFYNITKYKSLLDSGVITQEEFDAKKKQLLKR